MGFIIYKKKIKMSFRKAFRFYFSTGTVSESFSATTGASSSFLMLSVTVTELSVTVCSICSSEVASGLFLQFENNTTETRATKIKFFFKNK